MAEQSAGVRISNFFAKLVPRDLKNETKLQYTVKLLLSGKESFFEKVLHMYI